MRKILASLLFVVLSLFAFTQNVSFTAKAPAKAGVGQNFQVQYSVNKQGSNIKPGDYTGLKLVGGPSVATSQNIQIINGNYTQTNTYTYTYTFQASSVGTYTIGGASISVDGQTINSNSVSIEIQKDPVQTQGGRRRNNDPWAEFDNMFSQPNTQQQQPKEITGEDLFVRVLVDKTDIYKGEPVIATIKVYTKVDLLGFEDITLPAFNSFYAEEIETPDRINLVRETYNGQAYNTALLKKYVLYPRYTGNAIIESCNIKCQIRQPVSGGGFYNFFGYYETLKKSISSPEISINVKQLPPEPAGYSGAIGNFTIKLEKSADTIIVNDAVTVKITLNGTGNFNMIETPKIIWPKEFEVYDPIVSLNTNATAGGVSGSKLWEFTVIPRYPGIFRMGQFNFQYFDLATRQYKTVMTQDLTLAVRKDIHDTKFGDNDYNYVQRNVEYIGDEDIRFVKTKPFKLVKSYTPIVSNAYFAFFFITPLLIFIFLIIFLRKKIKENADIAAVRVKKAGKVSRKRLRKAKKYMLQQNSAEFYKEVISALWGYASDRFNIPISDLTKDRVITVLEALKIDAAITNKLIDIIDICEFAHFAPSKAENELSIIYNRATEIIEELEKTIKA